MVSFNFLLVVLLKRFILSWIGPCPSGWVIGPDKSKCFRYTRSPLSWNESEALCEGYRGHLAALTSLEELSFARGICREVVNGCWVGGRGINSTIGFGWKWSDNTSHWNDSIFSVQSNCTGFACHTNNSVGLCTLLINGSTSAISERCNMSHAYICKIDIGRYFFFLSQVVDVLLLLYCCCYLGIMLTLWR